MRTTYFTKVELQRKIPYDPNFHGLVEKRVDINLDIASSELEDALFRISLKVRFVLKASGEEMGFVSASAESRISGMVAPRNSDGTLDPKKLTPEFMRVIDGAVGEDMLIPLSVLARQAHLPSLLPIPAIVRPVVSSAVAEARVSSKARRVVPVRRSAASKAAKSNARERAPPTRSK